MMKLKNKTAVVTGGARGIGRAIVNEFAREGAKVLFTYVSSRDTAHELETGIKNQGGFARGYQLDVRDFVRIEQWKEQVLEEYGSVDILVNNAGIIKDKALALMSREEWLDVIDTNLNGAFNLIRTFITGFIKQRRGNIINISSLSGVIGMPRQSNYSAAKGGLNSFSLSLAKEAGPYNVRVNVVAPGFIRTDMLKGLKEEYAAKVMERIPLGRFGDPEEVAKVVLFLAGEESAYITGQIIRIDGGLGM